MRVACAFLALSLLAGCSDANRIADDAHRLAAVQTENIVTDLYGISRQLVIDKYAAQARAAATSGDAEAAVKAVLDAITEYDRITWLSREEFTKAQEVNDLSRQYILMQRGWTTVLREKWAEAEREAKEQDSHVNETVRGVTTH